MGSAADYTAQTVTSVACCLAAWIVLAGFGISAQGTPRTPDGRPDLQGMWLNDTATPLERTKDVADKAFFTEAEAREYERTISWTEPPR